MNYLMEQLQQEFSNVESFTRKELNDFFCRYEPDLKETTFRWRIYDLKQKGVLNTLGRGLFSLDFKPVFKPEETILGQKISNDIRNQFYDLKYCVWTTQMLHELMLHLPGKSITILEVEKDALEIVFNYLKDSYSNVYLKPDEKEIERYVFSNDNALVIQSLVTKAPIQKINKIPTSTLEKLIVDVYSDSDLFSAYQGTELVHIVNTAIDKYNIDYTKLISYSKRRGKEEGILAFLKNKTNAPKEVLHD